MEAETVEKKSKEYAWALNQDEPFVAGFPSILEAYEAAIKDHPEHRVICIGKVRRPEASDFFRAKDILEYAGERAADEFGSDYTEDFPDVSEAAEEDLQKHLDLWAKHWLGEPRFFAVEKVKWYTRRNDVLYEVRFGTDEKEVGATAVDEKDGVS